MFSEFKDGLNYLHGEPIQSVVERTPILAILSFILAASGRQAMSLGPVGCVRRIRPTSDTLLQELTL
jgi:hypothetical protein